MPGGHWKTLASTSHQVERERGAVIGHDKAVWAELGTVKQPPRSFLLEAAINKEAEVVKMAGRAAKAVVTGNMDGLSEYLHKEAWHDLKELGHTLSENRAEDENRHRR